METFFEHTWYIFALVAALSFGWRIGRKLTILTEDLRSRGRYLNQIVDEIDIWMVSFGVPVFVVSAAYIVWLVDVAWTPDAFDLKFFAAILALFAILGSVASAGFGTTNIIRDLIEFWQHGRFEKKQNDADQDHKHVKNIWPVIGVPGNDNTSPQLRQHLEWWVAKDK